MAGKDLRLAIERQMIAVLGHQHLGQQSLGCHAAGQRPLGRRRLHYGALATAAPITRTADYLDLVERGNDVEHLGDVLADHMHRTAAVRAALVFDIDHHLDPRQMRRQGAAVAQRRLALAGRLSVGRRFQIDCGLRRAERLSDLLQCELQLIRVELFRARPVAAAHQLLDDQLQFLDLGIGSVALRPERLTLDAQLLYCAVLRFQHRCQRREPRLEQGGILQRLVSLKEHAAIILAIVQSPQNCPSTGQYWRNHWPWPHPRPVQSF